MIGNLRKMFEDKILRGSKKEFFNAELIILLIAFIMIYEL